jgi:XTP/dITP diphosphohydrolase
MMKKIQLVFATNNQKKIEEIQQQLPDHLTLISLKDIGCTEELAEDGETLLDNSFQKANYIYQNYGVSCFADDTGLLVEALGGAPGVYSARYAGDARNNEANIALLLANLSHSPNRSAKFQTVITLLQNNEKHTFIGEVNGEITERKIGEGGFGYDAVFKPEGMNKTFAELTTDEKNAISHRGKAVSQLIDFLSTNK